MGGREDDARAQVGSLTAIQQPLALTLGFEDKESFHCSSRLHVGVMGQDFPSKSLWSVRTAVFSVYEHQG